MPTVARLSIAPVRGLGLEHPTEVDLTEVGVVEDRRFFLIDQTHRIIDGLVFGGLVRIRAHTDPGATMLRLTFPDGVVVEDEVRLAQAVEIPIHGRTGVGRVVDGPWAAALSAFVGRDVSVVRCDRPGGTRRGNPASLVSDGSLAELARQIDRPDVDARRFRMLIEIAGAAAHEEDSWIGWRIGIGDAILAVTLPDARCAVTTQHPESGVRDLDTLRTLIAYRGLRDGEFADFGVLADVAQPGRVRLGDEVVVLDSTSTSAGAASLPSAG
ncbi:MAG: MOSC domain-containing protein [Candidatus Limnocylindrales bacterium]